MIRVRKNPSGWWEVAGPDGELLAQYTSEFQARAAGRIHAGVLDVDLMIHQPDGPPIHEMPKETSTPRATAPTTRKPLVLIVEDQLDSRELWAEYLTYAGFSVATAINGHEAVRLAEMLRPDLVLMDIRLPGMDGLEATGDLKRDPQLAHIPVVAITADPSYDMEERCRAAGCDAFIAKPVLPDEVVRQIRQILARAEDAGRR